MSSTKPSGTSPKPSTSGTKSTSEHQKTDNNKPSNRTESRSTSSISSNRNENDAAAAAASLPAQPERSKVKRFFLKISEKMGTVEQTHYSPEFLETVQELDNYKKSLEDVLQNLAGVIQRNPKAHSPRLEKLEFEYAENTNPYELLYPALNNFCGFLNASDVKKQVDKASKLGEIHRGFHRRSKRCLKNVRKFLLEDYEIICEARKILNDRREDMDFAKHELLKAKTPEVIEMKNSVYENSQKHFETQLRKVVALLDQVPKMRDSHLKDLQSFHAVYKVYHDQMSHVLTSK